MTPSERSPSGPLEGLKVIDLSPDRVGAQVSQTLADFGADVVWVEPPGGGRLRSQPAFPFLVRGKRSVIADLRTAAGVERIRAMAASADILIETFRPGVAERLGLGHQLLSAANPALIYTSISGFGRHGPWADVKGYEPVVTAVLGINATFSAIHPDGHPPFVAVPWCTFAASQAALHGILSALLERDRSGSGQWVETNLAQSVMVHEGAASAWYRRLVVQRYPEAFVPSLAMSGDGIPMTPFIFRLLVAQTRDGHWLQFAQNRPRLFEAFLRALGLDWMLTDPKWKGIPELADPELRTELWHLLLHAVKERSLADWQRIFAADHDVFAERLRSGPDVLEHPQLIHDGLTIELDDAERGPVRQPGPLFHLKKTPALPGGSAPVLGGGSGTAWDAVAGRSGGAASTSGPPLDGVTVLELAIQFAAPYAATLLADLGARVIKIEPLSGDPIRRQAPEFPEVGGGKVMYGKESVAVDLKSPEGQEIIHRIAARADLVVEGFREGAAERNHLDADTLRAINPDLVYLSAHGYGLGGPLADRPSFAPTFGAAAGISAAHLGGLVREQPLDSLDDIAARSNVLRAASASVNASADGIGALGAATAALMGLVARARGAGGQHVVSSMLQSTVHAMAQDVVSYAGHPAALAAGADFRGPSALNHVYDAADGWVLLVAPQPAEWHALAEALAPYLDLRSDQRFSTAADRVTNDSALTGVLAAVFARRGREQWQRDLTAVDVACVAVETRSPEELLMSEEYGGASGYLAEVDHPVFDRHPRLAPIVRFSRSTGAARGGGLCGDATDLVLAEIGYTPARIADLRARQIVA